MKMEGKSQTFSQSYGRKRKRKMSSSDEIVSSSDDDSERMCKTLCKEHPGGSKQPDHGRQKQKRSLKEQEISDKYADRKSDNHELHLKGSHGKDRDWRSLCKSEISECRKGKNKKRKIHETSSSDSSGSNDSDSSFDGKKHKHSKKKRSRKHVKKKKKSSHKGPVQLSEYMQQRSSVTGEVIKRKIKKTSRDKEREKNRKNLLDFLNS